MVTKKAKPQAPVPCLVCGAQLPLAKHSRTNPDDGTLFRSYGSNGTKLDVVLALASFVEIIVCDNCLRTAARQGRVLHGVPVPRFTPPTRYALAEVDDDGQLVDGGSPWLVERD